MVGIVVLLAGCSARDASDEQTTGGAFSSGSSSAEGEAFDPAFSGGDAVAADGEASRDTTGAARSVITTGSLALTVADPLDAADEVVRIVEAADGRIDERTDNPVEAREDSSATLTVRIPSDDLTTTIDRVEALGVVRWSTLSNTDVTSTVRDLDARITALARSTDRLLDLLDTATDTDDLLSIEQALSQRQADLESLESERRSIGDSVDLATVTIDLASEETAPADSPETFLGGLAVGWESIITVASGALVALGVLLPWLAVAAIVAAVAVAAVRARARRRESAPSADTRNGPTLDASGASSVRMDE
ncbi:DUF4349 domain-containing protein [Marisediminicola sp. LYQ85]|uniref:DUF4349 domain-containing protein n=1 Tax=Marisediminicola sp. LYQ85 TaxID=3391062 RepID=UPI0039839B71